MFKNKSANTKLDQYILSKQKKIAGLLEKGIFEVVIIADITTHAQIFHSCYVNKTKNAGIDKAYEKSRLVIQAYNNQEKDFVLIQLPTI